jgi:RNA polymerase sigma-70 factor (ECF subfamily)
MKDHDLDHIPRPEGSEAVSPVKDGQLGTAAVAGAPVDPMPSYDDFYAANRRGVLSLAWSLTGDSSTAEELAQDAFLEALRSWDKIGRYDRPDAWVRRVVANRAVSRFRRRRSERGAMAKLRAERLRVVDAPALPDEDEQFWRHVRALPPRQAQCVALHYLEDRPVAEIAEILGCTETTVRVHLHRGRLALAERLEITEDGR